MAKRAEVSTNHVGEVGQETLDCSSDRKFVYFMGYLGFQCELNLLRRAKEGNILADAPKVSGLAEGQKAGRSSRYRGSRSGIQKSFDQLTSKTVAHSTILPRMRKCSLRPYLSVAVTAGKRVRSSRNYAVQAPGAPTLQIFNQHVKYLQKERAASNRDESRKVDYLKDEVAQRLCERLLVRISRSAYALYAHPSPRTFNATSRRYWTLEPIA